MRIIGIDPGPVQSAAVVYDTDIEWVTLKVFWENLTLDSWLGNVEEARSADVLAIEDIQSYGGPVGADVFETCEWLGIFKRSWWGPMCNHRATKNLRCITNPVISSWLTNQPRAKKSQIRQRLIDIFGGVDGRKKAIGTKKDPGPLHEITNHLWDALAVAVVAKLMYERDKSDDYRVGVQEEEH